MGQYCFRLPLEVFVDHMLNKVGVVSHIETRIKDLSCDEVSITQINSAQWMFSGLSAQGDEASYVITDSDIYRELEILHVQQKREQQALDLKQHLLETVIGVRNLQVDLSDDMVLEIGKDKAVLKLGTAGDVMVSDVLERRERLTGQDSPQPYMGYQSRAGFGPQTYGSRLQNPGFGPQPQPEQPWGYPGNANHGQGFSVGMSSGFLNGKALAKSISVRYPNTDYDVIVNTLEDRIGKPLDYITGAVFTDLSAYNRVQLSYPIDVVVINDIVHIATRNGTTMQPIVFK